jgi:CSLREA domain-containing protein
MRVRAFSFAAIAAFLIAAAPAAAATYTVTTTADTTGLCPPARGLQCTLRTAITNANNNPGSEIDLPTGDYALASALPNLTARPTTIVGHSASDTFIRSTGTFRTLTLNAEAILALGNVTVANGNATTAQPATGGNILVNAGAALILAASRVTGGQALDGGGIALSNGSATIAESLVDGNKAVGASGNNGGGLYITGTGTETVNVSDSTLTGNSGNDGGGIYAGNTAATLSLTRSTISGNTAASTKGGGITVAAGAAVNATGTILSGNQGNLGVLASQPGPSNCLGKLTSAGYNIDTLGDCQFTAATDTTADPALQPLHDNGGPTPTLAPAGNSSAINRIPASDTDVCTPAVAVTDQRGVARPQGAGCDSGAVELGLPAASIDSAPQPIISGSAATFTFSSGEPGVTFSCKLDGPRGPGAFGPCVSPANFGALQPGAYTFTLRTSDAGGNSTDLTRTFTVAAPQAQATPTPTPTTTPTPPPKPVLGKSVVGVRLSGTVLVQLPGTHTFVAVTTLESIPLNSIIDTRHGVIQITSKTGSVMKFYDGLFKVTQSGGVTTMVLTEELAKCPSGKAASIAKKKPKTRKLWGDGSGAFSTRGQYSAATVRGTKWLVEDSCGKTLTRVAKGVVSVRDLVKRRTILLRAPHSYTARKKR